MQQRRHVQQTASLEERLAEQARKARARARQLPPCKEREELLRNARHRETAASMAEWLKLPVPSDD